MDSYLQVIVKHTSQLINVKIKKPLRGKDKAYLGVDAHNTMTKRRRIRNSTESL